MMIRTKQDIHAFEKAIDRCNNSVWLVSPEGEQYDLKSDMERYLGIARLIQDQKNEMELFAATYADEMIMMDFYRRHCA